MTTRQVSAASDSVGAGGDVWGGPARRPGRGRRPRRWALFGMGLFLVAGSVVAGLTLWGEAGATREVLVAARPITAGHVLGRADLRAVALGGTEGVSVVAASDAARLVGAVATVPMPAGAVIPADVTRAGLLPPAAQAVVSVALPAGAVPALASPGSPVRLFAIPVTGRPAPIGVPESGWPAVLVAVAPGGSGAAITVSLQVAEQDAGAILEAGDGVRVVVVNGDR